MDEKNGNLKKRIIRRTTSAQFEKLVEHLEASPHLVFGYPCTQVRKARSKAAWINIARSLNAIGPPKRTVSEWKKTWADLRNRTRQNIAEINKCDLYLTEGRWKPLTALEARVAKLCNLSTNPTSLNNVPISTPINRVAVVTPNFSSTLPNLSPTSPPMSSSKSTHKTMKKKISKQKRQAYVKELDLLRKQVAIQEEIAGIMKSQVELAEETNTSLNEMAEACKLIASSMSAFIKHLK